MMSKLFNNLRNSAPKMSRNAIPHEAYKKCNDMILLVYKSILKAIIKLCIKISGNKFVYTIFSFYISNTLKEHNIRNTWKPCRRFKVATILYKLIKNGFNFTLDPT